MTKMLAFYEPTRYNEIINGGIKEVSHANSHSNQSGQHDSHRRGTSQMSCTHENAVVVPPCCTTPDSDTGLVSCGCGGMSTVECPDCDQELTEDEINAIMEGRN